MKALYIKGSTALSDSQRKKYRGHRIENAEAFGVVARGITEAEVIGDYPHIVAALKSAGVKVEGGKPDGKRRGRPPKVEADEESIGD